MIRAIEYFFTLKNLYQYSIRNFSIGVVLLIVSFLFFLFFVEVKETLTIANILEVQRRKIYLLHHRQVVTQIYISLLQKVHHFTIIYLFQLENNFVYANRKLIFPVDHFFSFFRYSLSPFPSILSFSLGYDPG